MQSWATYEDLDNGWSMDAISTELVNFLRGTAGFDVDVQDWRVANTPSAAAASDANISSAVVALTDSSS